MFLLGLTGGIGMGKSETARIFRRLGVSVFDADATVHALYARGGAAVGVIAQAFPETIVDGTVARIKLTAAVVGNSAEMTKLEAMIHPLVRAAEEQFLSDAFAGDAPIVVLDIPLLFETHREDSLDAVAVVTAPTEIQRMRVARRPGMTKEKLEMVLARQMPDVEKRARADFVIETGKGLDYALHQAKQILGLVAERVPKAWQERQQGRG